jgi:hypothetical protein
MVESPPSTLYLLGNIQPGKSEKKLHPLGWVPSWKRTAGHSPILIKGTSRRGKVRKNLNPPENSQAGTRNSDQGPHLIKEHPEGKKGETILVPVRFSRVARASVPADGREGRPYWFCDGSIYAIFFMQDDAKSGRAISDSVSNSPTNNIRHQVGYLAEL